MIVGSGEFKYRGGCRHEASAPRLTVPHLVPADAYECLWARGRVEVSRRVGVVYDHRRREL